MNLRDIIDRLSDHFGITEHSEKMKLTFRVKQLQKMGWPVGFNTGRGTRDNWSDEAYIDLLIVSELRALGLPAQIAIDATKENLKELRLAAAKKSVASIGFNAFGARQTKSRVVVDFTG